MANWLGVDPGASGGIVFLRSNGKVDILPLKDVDHYYVRDWISTCVLTSHEPIYACIERVSGFMGGEDEDGHKRNVASAHTMFILGESFGALDMCLVCNRISRIHVLPKVWQKAMGLTRKKDETKPKHKGRIKSFAQARHPEGRITLQTSDAFVIALYCQSLRW